MVDRFDRRTFLIAMAIAGTRPDRCYRALVRTNSDAERRVWCRTLGICRSCDGPALHDSGGSLVSAWFLEVEVIDCLVIRVFLH
jgi:hypothetical protein